LMTRVLAPGCRLGLLLFRVQNPSSLALCRDRFGSISRVNWREKERGLFWIWGPAPRPPRFS